MYILRNGKRQKVRDLLEVVVHSDLGIPGFSNEFEINRGGMRFNPSIDYKCGERVVVKIFMENMAVLELCGTYLRSEDDGSSAVKFEPLSEKQQLILNKTLKRASGV